MRPVSVKMSGCLQTSWKYLGEFHKNETQSSGGQAKMMESGFFKVGGREDANSSHGQAF